MVTLPEEHDEIRFIKEFVSKCASAVNLQSIGRRALSKYRIRATIGQYSSKTPRKRSA